MSDPKYIVLAHHIKRMAETKPDYDVATFVSIDEDGTFVDDVRTYSALWNNGQKLAAGLLDMGQRIGDTFGIVMQNHAEFADLMVASSITGSVFVPIDSRSKGKKLTYMLDFAECRGVVVADYAWKELKSALPNLPKIEWVWVLGKMPKDAPKGLKLLNIADLMATESEIIPIKIDDPAMTMQLLYTSGTTGDPKAITSPYNRLAVAAMLPSIFGLTEVDRPYTGLSMTHANAQLITFGMSLYGGLRCVISQKFTKSRLWDITREYGCTVFNLLGGMTTAIYSEPRRDNDRDNPVRLVVSAGMPKAIWEDFGKRFDLEIFEMYGAAEGGLTFNAPGTGPAGSIGKAPPSLEVRIVDENDNEVPTGQAGEIIFRNADGTSPVVRYLKNPDATLKKTRGGWLRMGDIGYADEDGWLYFLYRSGGGIRRNGDFVNPAFVEKELAELDVIDDVFVYGVSLPKNAPGEKEVVAAIVPNDALEFDAAEIFKICAENLEGNFIPTFLQVVDEIPKTASEKPLERVLLDGFAIDGANIYTR